MQRRLSVKGDAQPRGGNHIDVIGTIAHGNRLAHAHSGIRGELPQEFLLGLAVNHLAGYAAGELAIGDLQSIGADVVQVHFCG